MQANDHPRRHPRAALGSMTVLQSRKAGFATEFS
jgi:hypothetical protein